MYDANYRLSNTSVYNIAALRIWRTADFETLHSRDCQQRLRFHSCPSHSHVTSPSHCFALPFRPLSAPFEPNTWLHPLSTRLASRAVTTYRQAASVVLLLQPWQYPLEDMVVSLRTPLLTSSDDSPTSCLGGCLSFWNARERSETACHRFCVHLSDV